MGNFKSFDELKRARLAAYKGMAEGDVLGFLDQHTGFYPDPTHFIYELLQNAEDMNATEVSFRLFPDKLFFEHNGMKRDFELTDIDAITNKGKSPKADDPTQIGKFGMGFKAVYVYTTTPEIHSGEFDFRIENVIIPTDENVTKLAKKGFTQFIFPFNNPKKTAEEAVNEITEALLTLNETAILFLTNIKKINYNLPDDKEGYITLAEKIQNIRFLYSTTVKRPDAEKEITYWAKFFDKCPLIVNEITSGNAIKNFPVSVAYRLKAEEKKYTLDDSLIGKVCLFFPTEIDSLLHFHINAPFASTVARDNILSKGEDGEANEKLINQLAELTVESLHWLKKAKMLDYAAYATLPTTRDFENKSDSRYNVFATRIKEEFEREELFVTDDGVYASIDNIYNAADKDIKTILSSADIDRLYQKKWIPTAPLFSRVDAFIKQFNCRIENYSIENFIDALEINPHFFDNVLLKHIDNENYYKTLYFLLSKAKSREDYKYDFYSKHTQTKNDILKKVSFILCDDNKLHRIEDNIFIKTNYTPKHYLKNPIYLKITFKNSVQDNAIKHFLLNLGIEEMCERADLIADVSKDNVSVDDNVLKMMEIIEGYKLKNIKIEDFIETPIFLADNCSDGKVYKVKAKECCWSKEVAFFYSQTEYVLALEKYSIIKEGIPILKEIFNKLGGKYLPKIAQSRTPWTSFPRYYESFDRTRERSDTCEESTYTIAEFNWDHFEMIRENNLKDEALLLWQVVINCNDKKYFFTKYKPNKSAALQQCESSLVYYLKRTAWVPTKSGIYKRPYELTDDNLLDEFKYEQQSLLLAEISKKPNDLSDELQKKGIKDKNLNEFAMLDADLQREALEYAMKKKYAKARDTLSLPEALAAENKSQLPYDEDDDYGRDISIKNVNIRQQKQQQDFEESLTNKTTRKPVFSFTCLSTNGTAEKQFIKEQYHGKCQICGRPAIRKFNGQPYFEAINVINTANLDPKYLSSLDAGWNTLCLCPNCAAEYRYCAKDISDFETQVESTQIEDRRNEHIEIYITLRGLRTKIMYTPRHFSALQTAFKAFKNHNTN